MCPSRQKTLRPLFCAPRLNRPPSAQLTRGFPRLRCAKFISSSRGYPNPYRSRSDNYFANPSRCSDILTDRSDPRLPGVGIFANPTGRSTWLPFSLRRPCLPIYQLYLPTSPNRKSRKSTRYDTSPTSQFQYAPINATASSLSGLLTNHRNFSA